MSEKLKRLKFDNRTLEKLPIEKSGDYHVQRPIPNACFSLVRPTSLKNPKLVSQSSEALDLIGLKWDAELIDYFAGNLEIPGAKYAAHCYCGHQFGSFAGQLGDGATMYIGEITNQNGRRVEIQFKGAGKTPFSRTADGRKVLRSSIREYLCSEAMHHLGIPTTRAGTCVASFDSRVQRDKFYDGRATMEPCAVITRLAETFIRFGSFELAKETDRMTGRAGPSAGNKELITTLLDYTIDSFYPDQTAAQNKYEEFLAEISKRTANLVASWQLVGFCHGVLNTDNMSIVGLTIDYGPFGFMDRYDPEFICNASDDRGRYDYQSQPKICKWNLFKFSEQIDHLIPQEKAQEIIRENFDSTFLDAIVSGARKKFGLFVEDSADKDLFESFLQTMEETASDFTNTFRALSLLEIEDDGSVSTKSISELVEHIVSNCCYSVAEWKQSAGSGGREMDMIKMMLRHGMLSPEDQIRARAMVEEHERKLEVFNLSDDQKRKQDSDKWTAWMTVYASRLKEDLRFSDLTNMNVQKINQERRKTMNKSNPKVVLRNFLAEQVIQTAEEGNFEPMNKLFEILKTPFDDNIDAEYTKIVPSENIVLKVT